MKKNNRNTANLVMGIIVLEGIGRQLDSNLDLFSSAAPILDQGLFSF